MQSLKVSKRFFPDLQSGKKPFEVRKTRDRLFYVDQPLAFFEWDDVKQECTGRAYYAKITYLLRGPLPEAGLPEDVVVFALRKI